MIKKIHLLFILLLSFYTLFSQDVELSRINALDEFKWGVKFYNMGLYEKAVFSFERSISFDSLDLRTHRWLGQAYYMKGDVEAALLEWSILQEKDQSPLWLDKSIEIISANRGVINRLYSTEEWVPLYDKSLNRPSSILPLNDGGSIVVSFLDNKLTKFNSNGAAVETFTGGFEPFNRPYDIISDGKNGYIVSEFMGDKISFVNNLGIKTKSFNPSDSPFSGPSYLSKISNGYFYLSDWGNRRVCKFDLDGNLILSIEDEHLLRPTGLLVIGDDLYIADAANKTILLFDSSGNYIETVISDGLEGPEGLSLRDENIIIIADGLKIKEFDLYHKSLNDISDLQGRASKLTKAVSDANGNTLATDFNQSKFYSLTDISSLYGGLNIVIDSVSSSKFPKMEIEVQVYNRLGEPVVGLDNSNFLISENYKVVANRDVIFKGNNSKVINLGLILDFDISSKPFYDSFYDVTSTLNNELEHGDTISLVSAGKIPELVSKSKNSILNDLSKLPLDTFYNREGIDLSIKLAASTLMPSRSKREIILVSSGVKKESDFIKYSLNEINDFLINNRISLNVIYLESTKNPELEYLVRESGGTSRFLFSGIGAKGIINSQRDKKSGYYVLSYDSLKNIDNGELFTTVEVEINFIRKSGRSESGFFVPVKIIE